MSNMHNELASAFTFLDRLEKCVDSIDGFSALEDALLDHEQEVTVVSESNELFTRSSVDLLHGVDYLKNLDNT